MLRAALLLAVMAFLVDWSTKAWALQHLEGAAVPLGGLVLGVERNAAFAFSSASGWVEAWFVLAVRLATLGLVAGLLVRVAARSRRYASGFALMLGGGSGNAADLAFRDGAVVDFIGTRPFFFDWVGIPGHVHLVFNAADVAVVLGLGLISPLVSDYAIDLQRRLARWEARWRQRALPRRPRG